MARKQRQVEDNGSWQRAEELLEQDDDRFVDELRRITDGEALGNYAAKWYGDPRPKSRRLMLEYLKRPLNAYRHEALFKRLFKLAEKNQDDELMAHFLVVLDCAVRRQRVAQNRWQQRVCNTEEEARKQILEWEREGAAHVQSWDQRAWGIAGAKRWHAQATFRFETYREPPGTAMPRPYHDDALRRPSPIAEESRADFEAHRLYSAPTRRYLRRRAWRYFRQMGKKSPDRYVSAIAVGLKLYQDDDVGDGLALIDNWGLMHVLFHHSVVLNANPHGWRIVKGRRLGELEPAPYFEELWKRDSRVLLDLVRHGQCRPVRQWAIFLLRRDHESFLKQLSIEELFDLFSSSAVEVVELAAELLRSAPGLETISIDRWLKLLETDNVDLLNLMCELMQERVQPERVSLADAVRLAKNRTLPIAQLGFTWLRAQRPESEQDCEAVLGLAEAEADPLRLEMVQWARAVLRRSPAFQPEWVLELLDSRHPEVRAEGWSWLIEGPRLREDFAIWQKLFESPYDDVRLWLIGELEDRVKRGESSWVERDQLDDELLRFLWASVLLNVHRGGRWKPVAMEQITRRIQRRPDEAAQLLPILRSALRSIRGPEWRAGLTRVVQLTEARPELADVVGQMVPELELTQ